LLPFHSPPDLNRDREHLAQIPQEALHPHLWLSDERVRLGQDGRRAQRRRRRRHHRRAEDADIILFNTCSVREKAQEKVFSDLGRARQLKQLNPDL
jgi:hypothetical protein